ncbi:MAG: (d)CMP kinase [Candidatus Micrarchaeia archaeon]
MIITIDGPAGVGKTSVAILLSIELQKLFHYPFYFIDTGIIYRMFSFYHLNKQKIEINSIITLENFENISEPIDQFQKKYSFLYTEEIAIHTSKISQLSEIRELINKGIREKVFEIKKDRKAGFILTGRDCGTVIFKEADFKFYIYASIQIRAQRRYLQYLSEGKKNIKYEEILEKIRKRDEEDMNRKISPLPKPDNLPADFILINTDSLDLQQTVKKIISHITQKIS